MLKINFECKDNKYQEFDYSGKTYKVGELVQTYSKGFFKVVEISKPFDGKNYRDYDVNDHWNTTPIVKIKKEYTSTCKVNRGKPFTTNISNLRKIGDHLRALEKARDRAIQEYDDFFKIVENENKVSDTKA